MNKDLLIKLLESVVDGQTTVEDATGRLEHMGYEDIAYAHIDHHRSLRKGFPEVIFGEGKTADQIAGIMEKMQNQENIILCRCPHDRAGTEPDHDTGSWTHPNYFGRYFGYSSGQGGVFDGQGHGEHR